MVRVIINGEEVQSIRFPITEVGTTSTVTLTVENNSENFVELIPSVSDPDVTISKYPRSMRPRETAQGLLVFSPKAKRGDPLNTMLSTKEIRG